MDDQVADLIALSRGIEESRPDNAEELLALVHKMLCAHRDQYSAIEQLENEFLTPFYDEYGNETNKQRHSRIADIAAGTVSPNFTLHLFNRLESSGLAMIRPLAALAQTRKPKEMVIPPYVDEQAVVNGRLITRQRKNNLKAPPSQLIENAHLLHNEARQIGGKSAAEKRQLQAAANMAAAKRHWEGLVASGRPEHGIAKLVADRMGVTPKTIREWRRSGWGEDKRT